MITGLIILYAVVGIILLTLHDMNYGNVTVRDIVMYLFIGTWSWPIILLGIYWPRDIMDKIVIKKRSIK